MVNVVRRISDKAQTPSATLDAAIDFKTKDGKPNLLCLTFSWK